MSQPLDLDAIRDRAAAATPGPWTAAEDHHVDIPKTPTLTISPFMGSAKDAQFIAYAREDVPALIAEVERLRAENERDLIADALQNAWNDFCADTGSIPDAFTIHGPASTRVSADFHRGNFAQMVTDWLEIGQREVRAAVSHAEETPQPEEDLIRAQDFPGGAGYPVLPPSTSSEETPQP